MSAKDPQQYWPGLADACRRVYHATIDAIRDVAREKGYAIGLHGSLARDIDLIAVPWTDEAATADDLVAAIQATVEEHGPHRIAFISPNSPAEKPHGRRAWSIVTGGGPFIDLSVMPRSPEQSETA